jgi:hypothetical protein
MQKDPHHTDETPYELLGLPLDATLPEVREALKSFLRAKGRQFPRLLGPAQQAQKRLQNALGRAEVDIWLYDLKISGDASQPVTRLDLDDFSRPRALLPSQLYSALSARPEDLPRREIKPQKVKFSDVRSFDDIDTLLFEPEFDR